MARTAPPGNEERNERLAELVAKIGLAMVGLVLLAGCVTAVVVNIRADSQGGHSSGSVSITRFGARCDGQTDDTWALRLGIFAMQARGGGTLTIPARTCLIAGGGIRLADVTIEGQGKGSVLNFTSPGVVMSVVGSDVTFAHLSLLHSGTANAVLLLFSGKSASNVTLDHVHLDGQVASKPSYAMGLWLAEGGEYRNLQILHSDFTGFRYAIGINSNFRGVLDGLTIDSSLFHNNHADDIEINTPQGTGTNITITNNTFRDNQAGGSHGFGVGLANASNAVIKSNDFNGYPVRPIHIEDRSYNITIESNRMSNGSTSVLADHSSYIFIINGTHDVSIIANTIDASANTNPTLCVYSGVGGGPHGEPYNITGSGNTFTACRGSNGQATFGNVNLTDTTFV